MRTPCSICGQPSVGRSLCNAHYARWLRLGDTRADVPINFKGKGIAYRFWAKVQKTESCWIWIGGRKLDPRGILSYGFLVIAKRDVQAHRLSWELHRGPIPEGMKVLHNCPGGDNPACVNPDHLWLGTQAQNVLDCEAKGRGRHLRGEQNGKAKLNREIAAQIPALLKEKTRKQVAEMLGVGVNTVWKVVRGEHWTVRVTPGA
jgi:hypothetical protein